MKKETFIKKVEDRVEKFNTILNQAIEKMDGNNDFYYPAGESTVLGETDPIDQAKIIGTQDKKEDCYEYTEVTVRIDGEEVVCTWDEDEADFSELDDNARYLKRRIYRTLKLWEMDPDQVDKNIEEDKPEDEE